MKKQINKKGILGKGISAALSLVVFFSIAGSGSLRVSAGQEAKYSKEEVVYGTLDPDGSLDQLYVVNQFDVTSAGEISDYGNYDTVENLTDSSEIKSSRGTQNFSAEAGTFYYQGDQKNGTLPWNLKISYYLDGSEVSSDSLAGASGQLKIQVHSSENKKVDPVFFDNYLLQISFTLANDKYEDLVAEGASLAAAGEKKQISYTIMPGKEGDVELSAKIKDFEMAGISIVAIPFSMAFELPDTGEMADGLTDLSDGIQKLDDGTQKLSSSGQDLLTGMETLRDGISGFDTGVRSFSEGVLGINTGIQQIASNMQSLDEGAAGLATGSASVADGLNQLASSGSSLLEGSSGIAAGLAQANGALTAAGINSADVANDPVMQSLYQAVLAGYISDAQYQALAAAVGTVGGLSASYPAFASGLEQYSAGVSQAATGYGELNSGIASYASGITQLREGMATLANGSAELAGGTSQFMDGSLKLAQGAGEYTNGLKSYMDGVGELADGTKTMAEETVNMPKEMQDQIDEMTSQYSFDFTPVSFISEKNAQTASVQFMITTKAIEKAEKETKVAEETKTSFVDRIKNLFSGD